MLYHLFNWLTKNGIKFPGSGLFQFITFRVLIAVILSLVITTVYGKKIINFLKRKQIGESVRDLGLRGEKQKTGTGSRIARRGFSCRLNGCARCAEPAGPEFVRGWPVRARYVPTRSG